MVTPISSVYGAGWAFMTASTGANFAALAIRVLSFWAMATIFGWLWAKASSVLYLAA